MGIRNLPINISSILYTLYHKLIQRNSCICVRKPFVSSMQRLSWEDSCAGVFAYFCLECWLKDECYHPLSLRFKLQILSAKIWKKNIKKMKQQLWQEREHIHGHNFFGLCGWDIFLFSREDSRKGKHEDRGAFTIRETIGQEKPKCSFLLCCPNQRTLSSSNSTLLLKRQ